MVVKSLIPTLLAVCIGVGCRWFGIPLPGPPGHSRGLPCRGYGNWLHGHREDSDSRAALSCPPRCRPGQLGASSFRRQATSGVLPVS